MDVAVFGAGYVGVVTAACLAALGHRIWLVEVVPEKLALLREGKFPVGEPGLHEHSPYLQSGQIVPTSCVREAVSRTEVALVCVGTPSQMDGSSNLEQVRRVLAEIADAVGGCSGPYTIAIRSTMSSLKISEEVTPLLIERLKDRFGKDIVFAMNPEFLREGHAIEDFLHPPFVVVGTDHEAAARRLRELYDPIEAPFFVVSPGTASLLKYACNAFHATKVAFANEIASLEAAFAADANAVMSILCLDRSLNTSPAYLRPGYAFGGSCLPKDLRALTRVASFTGIACPLLDSVLASNSLIIQRSIDAVVSLDVREIALVGLSFKVGTDDLRESPLVELAEKLVGKGYPLRIFDPDVRPESLLGQNLLYINRHLEHLRLLLRDSDEDALSGADLIILGKPLLPPKRLMEVCRAGVRVLDLTRELPPHLPPFRVLRLNGGGWAEAVGNPLHVLESFRETQRLWSKP